MPDRPAVPAPGADPVYEPLRALSGIEWLRSLERCPPGCPRCAAEYLDAKEREEARYA